MNTKQNALVVWLVCGLTAFGIAHAEMPKEDTVKGAKDHPLLSRFTGSKLVAYSYKEFDEVIFAAGKAVFKDSKFVFEKTQSFGGKFTRIAYVYPPDRSAVEVMRNYQTAIQKAGLKTAFSCDKEACNRDLFGPMFSDRTQNDFRFEGDSNYVLSFNYGQFEPHYLLAGGTRSDGSPIHVAVYVVPPMNGANGGVYLEIVEPKAMETDKVSVNLNAGDMAKGIAAEGKIALYGIYFDTGKADIKPESKAQLDEMAKLMQQDAKLKVLVVGHTDNQGTFALNVDLSQKRAEAVAKALTTQYKIDANRLLAKGAANLSPVASNKEEAGRAKNRRVELVEQ